MKKFLFAIMLSVLMASMLSSVPAYAEDKYDEYESGENNVNAINGADVQVLGGSFEKRYQNNLEFMNSQFTDAKRLALFLRPSFNIASDNEDIIALAKSITKSAANDYEKAQLIHNWVCKNIYYSYDDDANVDYYGFAIDATGERILDDVGEPIYAQDAAYVLKTKRGVCEGYTNLTVALLRAVGIPAQFYEGWVCSGSEWGPHAWTGAYISSQKKWILLDTTFDSFNTYSDGEYVTGSTRQKYFDIDLNTFSQDHFNFTSIYVAHPDEEADLDVADDYGATVDYTRTDLYFYFAEATLGMYSKCAYGPGVGVWNTESLRFDTYNSWVSSNPKVATVGQNGVVIAHECGTTTISLAFLDKGMIASFELTVTTLDIGVYSPSLLTVGDDYLISVFDKNANFDEAAEIDSRYVTLSSSNPKVLTVDNTGKITAVGSGTAKITAILADGTSASSDEIKVNAVLSGIKIAHKTLIVKPNSETEVAVIGTPKDAIVDDQYLDWKSSNPKVATIDTSMDGLGLLTSYKEGTTTITAYVWEYDENNNEMIKYTDTCVVTVVKQYNVTFKSNGGKVVKTITATSNSVIKEPTAPTRAGYKFKGWYKDSKLTKSWDFTKDKVTTKTTLYAKWEKTTATIAKYKVTFVSNGVTYKTMTAKENSYLKAPANPTRKGYRFIGWYQNKDLTQTWNFTSCKVTQNKTLYAGWMPN